MRKLLTSIASLAALALVAVGLAACDVHLGPYAAIVDGKTISQQTLQDAVSSAASDSGYLCSITSDYQAQLRTHGVGSQTYDSEFTDFVLATLVRAQLAADEAASRGLQVTSMLGPVAAAQISGSLGSTSGCTESATKTLDGLSPGLRSAYQELYENLDLLGAKQQGVTLTTAGLAQYAANNPSAGDLVCLSYIQTSSQSAAVAAEKALAKGTNFDAEAAAVSTASPDTVGCPPLSQLPTAVVGPVSRLAVGKWTAPISLEGSYLILKVTGHQTATPTQLVQIVLGNAEQQFSSLLATLDKSSSVQIDPAYGTWSRTSGSGAPITQAAAPPDSFLLAPSAVLSPYAPAPSGSSPSSSSPPAG